MSTLNLVLRKAPRRQITPLGDLVVTRRWAIWSSRAASSTSNWVTSGSSSASRSATRTTSSGSRSAGSHGHERP